MARVYLEEEELHDIRKGYVVAKHNLTKATELIDYWQERCGTLEERTENLLDANKTLKGQLEAATK